RASARLPRVRPARRSLRPLQAHPGCPSRAGTPPAVHRASTRARRGPKNDAAVPPSPSHLSAFSVPAHRWKSLSSPPCLSSFAVPRPAGPPCTPRLAPRSPLALGERPAALPAVHNSDGPSGHPLIFGRRCRRLPCSEVFLPGIQEGFTCFDTTLRCVLPSLPRRNRTLPASFFAIRCCLCPKSRGLASSVTAYGACTTFDT